MASWSFVHTADIHLGSPRSYRYDPSRNENWATARKQMEEIGPEFVLIGGDMTYDGDEGMPVTFVTEGKPAAASGMKDGDIIKAIDGKTVGNVYDYMDRLGQLKAGQAVIVKIERDGDTIELLLQL